MRMVAPFAGVAGILLSAGVPEPVSLYGITLDAPLSIPACPDREQRLISGERFATRCYEPPWYPPKPEEWRSLTVHFADGAVPDISARMTFDIMVHDGKVQEIYFYTKGVEVEQDVEAGYDTLLELIDKFGAPENIFPANFRVTTINAPGSSPRVTTSGPYKGLNTNWSTGSVTVNFSIVVGAPAREGMIRVLTDAAAQYNIAHTRVVL